MGTPKVLLKVLGGGLPSCVVDEGELRWGRGICFAKGGEAWGNGAVAGECGGRGGRGLLGLRGIGSRESGWALEEALGSRRRCRRFGSGYGEGFELEENPSWIQERRLSVWKREALGGRLEDISDHATGGRLRRELMGGELCKKPRSQTREGASARWRFKRSLGLITPKSQNSPHRKSLDLSLEPYHSAVVIHQSIPAATRS